MEAINDNWWHNYLSKQGDGALNGTLCGFVTAIPIFLPGPCHKVPDWKDGAPVGQLLVDAWKESILKNGGTGLSKETPEASTTESGTSTSAPPGVWQAWQASHPTPPPDNPPDLTRMQPAAQTSPTQGGMCGNTQINPLRN